MQRYKLVRYIGVGENIRAHEPGPPNQNGFFFQGGGNFFKFSSPFKIEIDLGFQL